MKKILIIGTTALILIGTTVGAIMEQPEEQVTNAPVEHKELTITQADVDAQTPPTPEPVETPVETPKATPKSSPQVQVIEAPVVYKWAQQMADAHIAESDYKYVTAMLLDDNGWRTTGERLWQGNGMVSGVQNNEATVSAMLPRARNWVLKNYESWSVAYDRWNTAGNF